MLDDARGAVPVSFSAAGKISVMLHPSCELPATATGRRYFYFEKMAHLEPCNSYCWFEVLNGGFRRTAALSKRRFLSSAPEHYWQNQIEGLRCNGRKCDT
jgi:hypothetical protein